MKQLQNALPKNLNLSPAIFGFLLRFVVMDAKREKSLALFPAKFQKSMWMKRGSFVVVDESGREEALEAGSKVACIVSQVLFHEQVRRLEKRPEWPEAFKLEAIESCATTSPGPTPEETDETNTSDNDNDDDDDDDDDGDDDDDDDDGLPPLEANMNRVQPFDVHASNSDSDTDSEKNL